jgi:hypothetical protein
MNKRENYRIEWSDIPVGEEGQQVWPGGAHPKHEKWKHKKQNHKNKPFVEEP